LLGWLRNQLMLALMMQQRLQLIEVRLVVQVKKM